MDSKALSLSLVLRKRGSPDALQSSAQESGANTSPQRGLADKPYWKSPVLSLKMSESLWGMDASSIPPDTSETVPFSRRKGDVLTPWVWYSRLSEEDKRRWEARSAAASSSALSESPPWP